jgi:hypothetical protein
MVSVEMTNIALESLAVDFFRKSEGSWKSQRRYYSLDRDTEPQEVESLLTISFLEAGTPELIELARSHEIDNLELVCGTKVTWESNYTNKSRKPSNGSTIFGISGNKLYRDRGFATPKPIIALCSFTNPDTMCLRTEYNGSVFEEELKLIGTKYRTRQTIISRAGEEITIGQYLEQRLDR